MVHAEDESSALILTVPLLSQLSIETIWPKHFSLSNVTNAIFEAKVTFTSGNIYLFYSMVSLTTTVRYIQLGAFIPSQFALDSVILGYFDPLDVTHENVQN